MNNEKNIKKIRIRSTTSNSDIINSINKTINYDILFGEESVVEELISANFFRIIQNSPDLVSTLRYINSFPNLQDVLEDNLVMVLSMCTSGHMEQIFDCVGFKFTKSHFINKKIKELLLECDNYELYEWLLRQDKSTLNRETKETINTAFTKNKDIIMSLLTNVLVEYQGKKEDIKSVKEVIESILNELMEKGNVDYSDIVLKNGAFSNVFIVGDYVLKVGKKRKTYEIPYNKRLLTPIIRIKFGKSNGNPRVLESDVSGVIEVSPRVKTGVSLSEEELYQLYKEMRKAGIICGDLRNENIGILLAPNKINYYDPLGEDLSARGIVGEQEEVLQAGDYVVIDLDYTFREDDPHFDMDTCLILECKKYEQRYLKEELDLSLNDDNFDKFSGKKW